MYFIVKHTIYFEIQTQSQNFPDNPCNHVISSYNDVQNGPTETFVVIHNNTSGIFDNASVTVSNIQASSRYKQFPVWFVKKGM